MKTTNVKRIIILLFAGLLSSAFCKKQLDPNKKRVLLIGVDGLLQTCMDKAHIEQFKLLEKQGSYTYNARTAIEAMSGPGWSNILCGLETEDTGVTGNDWVAPWLYGYPAKIDPLTNNDPFPCVFSEIKRNNKNALVKVTWAWDWFINLGNISIPGSIDVEDLCDPGDSMSESILCDLDTVRNGLRHMGEDFDFLFTYFGSVDETGHTYGFCGPEYIERVSGVNKNIEILLEGLKNNGIEENTYVILTTDHGAAFGTKKHGFQTDENMYIPFYIRGPGIKKGYELQDLVKNADVTPTVLHMLGFGSDKLWRSRVVSEAWEHFVEIPKVDLKREKKHNQKKIENMEDLKFLIDNDLGR
jgi:predicted AlkP superfamily pyrophosphatase or phosphodiesterase